MTRPQRQPDTQAAVLADPAAHWPQRPGWTCAVDEQPWPCEPLRRHLLATMPAQDIGLAMGARYVFAVRELAGPAAEVHHQLVGWVRSQ